MSAFGSKPDVATFFRTDRMRQGGNVNNKYESDKTVADWRRDRKSAAYASPMTIRRYLSSPATRPVFGLTRCNLRQAAHSIDLNTSASAISSATNACTLSRVFGQRKRTGRMRNLRLGRPQAFFSGLITYTPAAIAMIATTTNKTIWSVSESIFPSIRNGMDF